MNLDTMKRYGTHEIVDAVVIGTGAGGSPLLAELAGAGLRVVALEAGRNRTPNNFTADEIVAAEIYWLGERLSAGETPEAFGANNSGTGVGGSTLHWGAYAPRADPRDLRLRSDQGVGEDWPVSHDELLPYYRRVEAFIGVSGPASYPWDPARRYPLPPVPLNAPAQMMQAGCAALGVRTCEAPIAAVSRDFLQSGSSTRPACINCGYCHQGCRTGAKTSMAVTYLPQAVAAGAEIRPECFVHDLERDAGGRITAVVYRSGGVDHRQKCAAVFLCAGAIETPRLLLHLGLANSSGQVGRNYMAHVATQVWGTFEQEMRPNKGFPASLITEDMLRAADADFSAGYLVQSLGIVPVTWAAQVTRGRGLWGQPLVDYIQKFNHVAGIGINGECLPQPGNYLELSDEIDDTGMRKPRVNFSYGPNEQAMSRHAAKFMTAAWEQAGASDIWTFERSAHTIGTCRMGNDPDRAVAAFAGTFALLRLTDLGLFIRTVTQNRDMAGCVGISTRRVDVAAFALGGGLAGLGGLALSPIYNVNPTMGTGFIIDSFMVVVLGGVGSLFGTALAALGIGLVDVGIEPFYGAVAAKVIVLLLIVLLIQWRPEGLVAPKGRR